MLKDEKSWKIPFFFSFNQQVSNKGIIALQFIIIPLTKLRNKNLIIIRK